MQLLLKASKPINKAHLVPVQKQVIKNGATFTQTFWVSPAEAQEIKGKHTQHGTFDYDHFTKNSQDRTKRAEMIEYLKNHGIKWKENSNEGINWMRARMAMNAHIEEVSGKGQQVVVNPQPKVKQSPSKNIRNKPVQPKGQAKFDITQFGNLKTQDKAKALQYLKDSGITWNESNNPNINWMRACMAAKKIAVSQPSSQEQNKEHASQGEIVIKRKAPTDKQASVQKNLTEILKKKSSNLSAKHIKQIEKAFENVQGNMRVLAEYVLANTLITGVAEKGAGFRPNTRNIEMDTKTLKDSAWYQASIRHEVFHAFDYMTDPEGFSVRSHFKVFKTPLKNSIRTICQQLQGDASKIAAIQKDISKLSINDRVIVNDLFDNIFAGRVKGFKGHGEQYYNHLVGVDMSEAGANLYTLVVGNRKSALKLIDKYAPGLLKDFDSTINILVKEIESEKANQ